MKSHAETAACLSPRFQAVHDHFKAFSRETSELHSALKVNDEPSRAAFTALSRLQAFADQIDLIMALMREDVQVIDELTGERAEVVWSEQFGESFNQWLRTSLRGAAKVN